MRQRKQRKKPALSVRAYARRWVNERRARGVESVSNEEARLRLYILPQLGRLPLRGRAIRPRHIRKFVATLRKEPGASGRPLAPRSIRAIYSVVHRLFEDAIADELIDFSPCRLRRHELPEIVDRDPAWRAQAIFSKVEVERLLSDARIPEDRTIVYAIAACAGLRAGELSALRWHHYEPTAEPLARLVVARSFSRISKQEKEVKTGRPRQVPVHPILRDLLENWRDYGWNKIMGRAPRADDLIVPGLTGQNRRCRHGWKRFQDDLDRIGLRRRRFHDLRRTFISLCLSDGARKDVLRWISHGRSGDIMDLYTTLPWSALCEAVATLKLSVGPSLVRRQLELFSDERDGPIRFKPEEKRITYRRDKLYEEVWSEPTPTVATSYGVSNVMLAKMCRRLGVPHPGRGYWAKIAAGQQVKRPPLPPPPSGGHHEIVVIYLTIGERRVIRLEAT